MTPSTTHDHIAAWIAANPKTQGAMIDERADDQRYPFLPLGELRERSDAHEKNDHAADPCRSRRHEVPGESEGPGDTNSSMPQIRLIQSWTFFSPPRNEALFAISNLLHYTRR